MWALKYSVSTYPERFFWLAVYFNSGTFFSQKIGRKWKTWINCNVANLPFCYSQPLMAEHKEIVIDMISRSFADKGDLTTLANVSYENIAEQVRTKHDKQWNQKVAYTFPLVPMAWQRNRKRQQKIYTPYRYNFTQYRILRKYLFCNILKNFIVKNKKIKFVYN